MKNPKKIIIIPAGGMGPAICEIVCLDWERYEMIGFLDDNEELVGKLVPAYAMGMFEDSDGRPTRIPDHIMVETSYPVIGRLASFTEYYELDYQFIIAGFANDKEIDRVRRTRKIMDLPDDRFETVIHPSATVSRMAHTGHGTVISAGVRIAPGVTVGNHVMVMPNVVIEHNSVIGDFCNICAGAIISGYVNIGEACWIGANASITSKINIGHDCLVGIGAVVIRDIKRNSVVVGNPARFLRRTYEHRNVSGSDIG